MDVIAAANAAIANRSAVAPALAFAAGAATAIGPCAAPRMIAAVGLVGPEASVAKRALLLIALVCGLCTAYVAIGLAASVVGAVMRQSTPLYVVFALVFAASGIRMIVGPRSHTCALEETHAKQSSASTGAAFLLGLSMGLLVSPCCTPIVAAMVGLGAAIGSIGLGVATIGSFALGHAVPLVVAGLGAGTIRYRLSGYEVPVATIGGALLIGLSAYYAVLA